MAVVTECSTAIVVVPRVIVKSHVPALPTLEYQKLKTPLLVVVLRLYSV